MWNAIAMSPLKSIRRMRSLAPGHVPFDIQGHYAGRIFLKSVDQRSVDGQLVHVDRAAAQNVNDIYHASGRRMFRFAIASACLKSIHRVRSQALSQILGDIHAILAERFFTKSVDQLTRDIYQSTVDRAAAQDMSAIYHRFDRRTLSANAIANIFSESRAGMRSHAPGHVVHVIHRDNAGRTYSFTTQEENTVTAIKAAMQKAGVDIRAYELHIFAAQFLDKTKGNVQRAAEAMAKALSKQPDLLVEICLQFLKGKAQAKSAIVQAAPTLPSVRAKKSHHQREQTQSEKNALRSAMRDSIASMRSTFDRRRIEGRKVADMRWYELYGLLDDVKRDIGKDIQRIAPKAHDAGFLANLILHKQVIDQNIFVRDVVNEKTFARLDEEAKAATPERIKRLTQLALNEFPPYRAEQPSPRSLPR